MSALIVDDAAPRVRIVTLNRPKRMNALDGPTLEAPQAAVHECADPARDIRVVAIQGSGRAFCAAMKSMARPARFRSTRKQGNPMTVSNETLQRLADRAEIHDCMCRYAQGVDRGDWDMVRDAYHPDAIDEHGEYKGDIDGLMKWLDVRFAGIDNSMHFLGQSLVEFAARDFAFVETYFCSRRLRPPTEAEKAKLGAEDMMCREAWGRYLDHFERRDGRWRVARRIVVIEKGYTSVAVGGKRSPASPNTWGSRDASDLSHSSREDLFAKAAAAGRR